MLSLQSVLVKSWIIKKKKREKNLKEIIERMNLQKQKHKIKIKKTQAVESWPAYAHFLDSRKPTSFENRIATCLLRQTVI